MTVLIDNYDSFTYNIAEYLEKAGEPVQVFRNDAVTPEEILEMRPRALVISPGPGTPDDAGICLEAVRRCAGHMPILGVCLGHQVIVQAFGGRISRASVIVHGKVDQIDHDGKGLFRNISTTVEAARYHSLAADPATIPKELEVTSWSRKDDTIMGVRHTTLDIEGVQFHPESLGTPLGYKIIENFLSYRREASPVLDILKKCARGADLSRGEAEEIMDEITSGELSESQLGAFLGSMSVKGLTALELSSFAHVLRRKTGITARIPGLLDTCGTGGDGKGTFNFSSAAALCCAAAGIPVAKHGNKAISSRSGSYDFLKTLGVSVEGDADQSLEDIRRHNFSFLFAPRYHQAMRHVGKVRQELHMRTLFNLIGPLVNPLAPDFQIVGVYDPEIMDVYAEALNLLGVRRALVVHSSDGMDELSVCAPTWIREVSEGKVTSWVFDPRDVSAAPAGMEELQGKNASENVEIFLQILRGDSVGPSLQGVTDGICLNAGAAAYLAGKAGSVSQGFHLIKQLIGDKTVMRFVESVRGQS